MSFIRIVPTPANRARWVPSTNYRPHPNETPEVRRELAWLFDQRPLPETWSAPTLAECRKDYRDVASLPDELTSPSLAACVDHLAARIQMRWDPS